MRPGQTGEGALRRAGSAGSGALRRAGLAGPGAPRRAGSAGLGALRRAGLAGVFAGLFVVVVAGCPPQVPPNRTAGPGTAVTVAPVTSASASAGASEALDAGAPDAAQEQEPRERPSRTGTPGSTRGTVACGKVRCNAPAERCFWDEKAFDWACRKVDPAAMKDADDIGFACDDGTDCPDGQTCCQLFENQMREHSACVARADVSPRCSVEICLPGGAKCPKDETCTSTSPDQEGGCDAKKGPATCAGKKRCPADKPACVQGPKGLACAAEGSAEFKAADSEHRWQCTRQQDCNGDEACSFAFGEVDHDYSTFCSKYNPAYMGTMVCDPTGPSPCGKNAECLKAYACRGSPDLPKWLGAFGPN